MKRILIAAAALTTLVAPLAASAQSYGYSRDGKSTAQERRELQLSRQRAARDGVITNRERRTIQNQRGDVRSAQRWDRTNRNWWQGRADFNGYEGRRAGYWYAPGYGYRQVDRRWADRRWSRGSVVPYGYRNYYVQDPYFYGLRPAGYGQRWVYVDNNLVLMSLATGLIIDLVAGAY